jgi:tight adherence protein B
MAGGPEPGESRKPLTRLAAALILLVLLVFVVVRLVLPRLQGSRAIAQPGATTTQELPAEGAPVNVAGSDKTSSELVAWADRIPSRLFVVSGLAFLAVATVFVGIWRVQRPADAVEQRIKEYGLDGLAILGDGAESAMASRKLSLGQRLSRRLGLGPRLAEQLALAGLPVTASEFVLIRFGAALAGFALGTWRLGLAAGGAAALLLGYLPSFYVRHAVKKRQRSFTDQLPDVLDLLSGALRAGHGIARGLQVLVEQLPPPASEEFARVQRIMGLGGSLPDALNSLSARIGTDDTELVMTAISIQHQLGGNLAATLDVIGETVRDRLRIQREIRTLTAQQRLTGYVLASLPLGFAVVVTMVSPTFLTPMLQPGWPRLLPAAAIALQVLGFVVMNRIVDIEV